MTIQLKRKQQGNIWMYMQSNLKKSQNQAEKLKKLSDVKRKVNFRSSQVEAFRNRKLSDQFLIILNTKIFVLNRKSGQPLMNNGISKTRSRKIETAKYSANG